MNIPPARKRDRQIGRQARRAGMDPILTQSMKEHLSGELIGQADGSVKVFRHACAVS